MARFAAFLDTCVLVPIGTADLLLRLAEAGLYRPLWNNVVLQELERVLVEVHPQLPEERARHRVGMMRDHFEDALVEGWEPLQDGCTLPDPHDVPILAAAIAGRADVLVTENLNDFPEETLAQLGLHAVSLDAFLLDQLDLSESTTIRVLGELAAARRNPPATVREVLDQLSRSGAPGFTEAARAKLWRLQSPRRAR